MGPQISLGLKDGLRGPQERRRWGPRVLRGTEGNPGAPLLALRGRAPAGFGCICARIQIALMAYCLVPYGLEPYGLVA